MATADGLEQKVGENKFGKDQAAHPFAHILVALDGSEFAESVFDEVVPLARAFASTVTCVCAVEPIDPVTLSEWAMPGAIAIGPLFETQDQIRQEEARYLTSVTEQLACHGIAANSQEPDGRAAETIIACARQLGADLIAMTTHGRSGVGRALLGSVADEVVRTAPCPVLLVRRPRAETRQQTTTWRAEGTSDAAMVQHAYRRIVVPLDGSELSEQVLTSVLPLVRRFASQVVLVSALGRLESSLDDAAEFDPERVKKLEHAEALLHRERAAYLTSVVEQLRQLDVVVECEASTDRAADAILECAHKHQADLIAMTTHGAGGLTRALVGSVADKVVHYASCPVLLVRSTART